MQILALNCGSSSLKFQLLDCCLGAETCMVKGRAAIGGAGKLAATLPDGTSVRASGMPLRSHRQALDAVWRVIADINGGRPGGIQAVGHRFVHGGNDFIQPALMDETNLKALRKTAGLDRLHNEGALEVLEAVREDLGPQIPMVTVFDTAFHQTLPETARRYALPEELVQKHNLWRFGFHGLAHRWMAERYDVIAGNAAPEPRLITVQLGGGASVTAVSGGRSVETSMGLTPTEGLMMGTRCGAVDPMISLLLAKREGLSQAQVEEVLYEKSGMLGVSGISGDIGELLEAEHRLNMRARLALDMFCYQVRKCIGAYLAVLGGAEAVVFGGGVGENQPVIRARICHGMDWCGIRLSEKLNRDMAGQEGCISDGGGGVPVYVIPVNEEALIARDTFQCLARNHAVPKKECHAC